MKPARPLLFDWQAHDRSVVRMGLAMILTVVALVGMFVVFRVVTPESRPVDVRPQRVMLLNPHDPAERALIHLAMDRSFGLLPSEPAVSEAPKGLQMPAFVPSYAGHELRLKPLPKTLTASTQVRPSALGLDVLPPLPVPVPTALPKPAPQILEAVFQGPAAGRAPVHVEIPGVPLADVTRPRFQVAVGRRGQVVMALPLVSSDDGEMNQKLHHAVLQMQFRPAETGADMDADTEWAQVSFQWVPKGQEASR